MYDLHMHSNCSDGILPPERIIDEAKAAGLTLAALTDHDCAAGVLRAAHRAEVIGQPFISGAEFEAEYHCELHILGLGIDPVHHSVTEAAKIDRRSRIFRNQLMLRKFQKAGIDLWGELDKPIETVTKPDIAAALVRLGCCRDISEAFSVYFVHGGEFDVPRVHLSRKRIMEMIAEAGGVAVLAHPMKIKGDAEELVRELAELGLWGIEAYYSEATEEETKHFLRLAEKYGLHPTCGSDYHGPKRHGIAELGCAWRDVPELCETEALLKEMNGVTDQAPAGKLIQRRRIRAFCSIDEFRVLADEVAEELPEEFFKGLNGGIAIIERAKLHEKSKAMRPLYVLGEYNYGGHAGRWINLYYGSFAKVHFMKRGEELKAELRRVLLHEFRHHLETRAGEHGLEYEDAAYIAEYVGDDE